MEEKIVLPKLGESILHASVVQWFKKEGDVVKEDEPLLEVTTDKVNSEIPSPFSGILSRIVAKEDSQVEVGEPLAFITLQNAPVEKEIKQPEVVCSQEPHSMKTYFSPAVLQRAAEQGVSLDILHKIKGSGSGGRVSKKDLEDYISQVIPSASPSSSERIKMSTMRKAIAENMVKSFYQAPHATLITEVDVTHIMKYIKDNKQDFLQKEGCKLTITPFIAKAIALAAKAYPFVNSYLESETIVLQPEVNLGVAVSVDQGVMVPVVLHCDRLDIPQIAKSLTTLSEKARNGTLKVEDTQRGTMTMTNFGMTGTLIGIPIIRYPEVAIIGVGAVNKKVMVLEDDSFAIRSMVYISLTFDHRVIDGIYGCEFLKRVEQELKAAFVLH